MCKMQIVIPMSGEGSRFKAGGYDALKPMITVNGRSIIEYVIEMFPGDHTFLFICREDHDEIYGFKKYFASVCPNSTVVLIKPPYLKLGPVYATLQAQEFIRNDEPVMLSYCDYFMTWDFDDFIREASGSDEDGNIVCYTGFHPHLLHEKNLYASCLVSNDMQLLEIKEKYSYQTDKTKGLHSVGAYYFKRGDLMKNYFKKFFDLGESLNGEFFVSLVYPLLLKDNFSVKVYNKVSFVCQWGTPEDLNEFLYWESVFKNNLYL